MNTATFTAGPGGQPTVLPKQIHVAVTSLAQLERLFRSSLSRGELFLPTRGSPGVGAPVEIEIAMEDSVTITLSARVSSEVGGPRGGVLTSFDPMSEFEFDAIASLLRETDAVRAPEPPAPKMIASGSQPGIEIFSRSTKPMGPEQHRLARLERELGRARQALAVGELDLASGGFERVLAADPGCREAVEGLMAVAGVRRNLESGRLAAILSR